MTVENWPGRGFYRGNKQALLADTNRVMGHLAMVQGTTVETVSAESYTQITPAPAGSLAAEMGAAVKVTMGVGEQISVTDIGPTKMSRKTAEQLGYTGDACDNCGSMKMQRTGHCNTCAECGTTTGCS